MLRDESEHSMVRHEAAEALGAIASDECLEALETASEDSSQVVRETAVLALQRFRYAQAKRRDAQAKNARADAKAPSSSPPSARPDERAGSAKEQLSASTNGHQQSLDEPDSPYISVDPVPAAPSDVPTHALRTTLLDESASLWDRYGAMFALRNRDDPSEVAKALGSVLVTSDSALLKHEVCYVLGQIQEKGNDARAALRATLENAREHPMVRHEAAEAIGSIAAEDTEALLLKFRDDQDRIVAESCEVALDIMQSEISGEFVPLVVEPTRAAA